MLAQVEYAIQNQQIHYINYDQPWRAYILPLSNPMAFLWQYYGKTVLFSWLHLPLLPVNVLNPYFDAVACIVQKIQKESR